MMGRIVLVALLAAGSAAAQPGGERTRLDDFAVPGGEGGPEVEQIGDSARNPVPPAPPAPDRSLAVPEPPPAPRQPLPQLSRPGEGEETPQLSASAESRELAARSVSSPADSRPQAAQRLSGSDRCDPQAAPETLAECRRILELRAAEFAAAEAPRMSPEQRLLAEQAQPQPGDLGRSTPRGALRMAVSGDPDADLQTNQELASIYLDRPAGVQPPAEPAEPELDPALAQILQGLQIDIGAVAP